MKSILMQGEKFGSEALEIYLEGCKAFNWNRSLAKFFAPKNELYSLGGIASPRDGRSVWILAHSSTYTGTMGGTHWNEFLNHDETILEHCDPVKSPGTNNDGKDRIVFAKKEDGKYEFMGIYSVDKNNPPTFEIVTYTRISKVYPI